MRSRTSSLPRSTCFARARSLPPSAVAASLAPSSSTSPCMWRAFCATRPSAGSRWLFRTGTVSDRLDTDGHCLAAADAQRGDAAPAAAFAERVQQRDEDARARGADGMAQGAGAAVDVDLLVGDAHV